MLSFTDLIILALSVHSITEIILTSTLFEPLIFKLKLSNLNEHTKEVLSCKFCFSVWVSIFSIIIYNFFPYFSYIFAIHCLSNIIHNIYDMMLSIKEKNKLSTLDMLKKS